MILNLSAKEFRGLQEMSPGLGLGICVLINSLADLGSWISLLVECHMAVAFAASIFGASRVLQAAASVLGYVWVFAPLSAVLEMGLTGQKWNGNLQEHGDACLIYREDYLFSVSILLGVLLCLSCYIASIVPISGAGQAVQRSVWRRAQLYLLVALITYVPIAVFYFVGFKQEGALLLVNTLFLSNGFLNFSVYAFQSKYLRPSMCKAPHRINGDAEGIAHRQSWRVNFKGDPSVVEPRLTLVSNVMASEMLRDASPIAPDADSILFIDYCEGALDAPPPAATEE